MNYKKTAALKYFVVNDYDKMFHEIDSITIDIYEKRNIE